MSEVLQIIATAMAFWLGGWIVLTTQRLKESPDDSISLQGIFQAMAWPWNVAKFWYGKRQEPIDD